MPFSKQNLRMILVYSLLGWFSIYLNKFKRVGGTASEKKEEAKENGTAHPERRSREIL